MPLSLHGYMCDLYEAAYDMLADFLTENKWKSVSKREVTNFYNLILEGLYQQFSCVQFIKKTP